MSLVGRTATIYDQTTASVVAHIVAYAPAKKIATVSFDDGLTERFYVDGNKLVSVDSTSGSPKLGLLREFSHLHASQSQSFLEQPANIQERAFLDEISSLKLLDISGDLNRSTTNLLGRRELPHHRTKRRSSLPDVRTWQESRPAALTTRAAEFPPPALEVVSPWYQEIKEKVKMHSELLSATIRESTIDRSRMPKPAYETPKNKSLRYISPPQRKLTPSSSPAGSRISYVEPSVFGSPPYSSDSRSSYEDEETGSGSNSRESSQLSVSTLH